MKKLELSEIKAFELDILKEVDRFCREKGISYSLAYGSLIGAIRHKGFIPWDDDIDIWMPRPDYDRFVEEFQHPYYRLQSPSKTHNWNCLFSKIDDTRTYIDKKGYSSFGVFLDIFPIDGLSNDIDKACKHYQTVKRYRQGYCDLNVFLTKTLSKDNKIKHNILSMLARFGSLFGVELLMVRTITNMMSKYDYEDSAYLADLNWGDERRIFIKEIFKNYIDVSFEDVQVRAIRDYDIVLTRIYGDYMQLPPKEQQVQYHSFNAYVFED